MKSLFLPLLAASFLYAQDVQNSGDPLYERAKKANAAFTFHADREYGFLDVKANAAGARFYLGPWMVDKAPIQNLKLPAGPYEYKLVLERFDSASGKFAVRTGEKQSVDAFLPPKRGTLAVGSAPNAEISVGGGQMGAAGDVLLSVPNLDNGQYRIKAARNGYLSQERMVKVTAGERAGCFFFLEKNRGSVHVESKIENSYVYVNNIYWGRSPITVDNLRPGKAQVRVEAKNYAPFSQSILIQSDETALVNAALTKDRAYKDIGPYGNLNGSWGDRDGDAIPDDGDKCPDDPEDIDQHQDQDGCPEPDNDFDGVADINEQDNKYRDLSEDWDGFEDKDGVPDFDNDQDNVPDSADACPFVQEDRDGFEEADGCPEPDNDGDRVADTIDLLPVDAEDLDGFQDADGAPDLDNDNDGVRDYLDLCPNAPEVFNNFQDDDGCPDAKVPEPRMGVIKLCRYDPEAPGLPDSVFNALDSVYNAMLAYPSILIEVKVHSDNKGKPKRKIQVTEEKAQIISRYLSYRGLLAADRYKVSGVGGADPIASNVSDKGREKNTRVEIKRVK